MPEATEGHGGAVTRILRFGDVAYLKIKLRWLLLDGVTGAATMVCRAASGLAKAGRSSAARRFADLPPSGKREIEVLLECSILAHGVPSQTDGPDQPAVTKDGL